MKQTLSFQKLPQEIKSTLLAWQKRGGDRYVFDKKLSLYTWFGLLAALLWFGLLFSESTNALWENWMFWAFAATSLSASLILVFSLINILEFYFSKLKSKFVFTRDEFFKLGGDRVDVWNLKNIEAVKYRQNGKFLEVWIGEKQINVPVTFEKDALELENIFDEWKKNSSAGLLESFAKPEFARNSSKRLLTLAGGAALAVVLGTGLTLAAQKLNRDFDDETVWKREVSANTIEAFEEYKTIHPNGIHAAEADAKIGENFKRLQKDFAASGKKDADVQAVKTFSEALENIARQPERKIYVTISETRNLDDETIQKLKKNSGLPISPYYYSLPPNQEENRKNKVFADLKQAFHQFTKDNSVVFERAETVPESQPSINIAYQARSAAIYYSFVMLINGGEQTNYYPGAVFDFDLTLNPANGENPYETTYETMPAKLNSNVFDERDAANYGFEKVYFGTVSEDFGRSLTGKFGLEN